MSVNVSHEQVVIALKARVGDDAVTIAAQGVAIDQLQADVTRLRAAVIALGGDPDAAEQTVTRSGEPDAQPAPTA